MIDNTTLEVIANDFVPIVPYNAKDLSIGMGQRYDVIITAKDLVSGNFWLRAIPQEACSETGAVDNVKGIIRYDNSSTADPTTSVYSYTDLCAGEDASNLVLYLPLNASDTYTYGEDEEVAVQVTDNALLWTMHKTSFRTEWENPTLMQVANGSTSFHCQATCHPTAASRPMGILCDPFALRPGSPDALSRSRLLDSGIRIR